LLTIPVSSAEWYVVRPLETAIVGEDVGGGVGDGLGVGGGGGVGVMIDSVLNVLELLCPMVVVPLLRATART